MEWVQVRQWMSVNDGLPPFRRIVLAMADNGPVFLASLRPNGVWEDERGLERNPTHWLEIPKREDLSCT